jgi:RimJ/RimL family protein N-acetyltransferase
MSAILVDLPIPIETDRLVIRPPQPGDGLELNCAVRESFPELHRWLPWAEKEPTSDESEENVRRAYARWILREDLRLTFFDRVSGRMVGSTGLHRIDWTLPRFEIGYWVRRSFGDRGYATEAVNALTRYAFQQLGAKRVEVRCDTHNLRSRAVVCKLRYAHEGTLLSDSTDAMGNPCDTMMYARTDTRDLPHLHVRW